MAAKLSTVLQTIIANGTSLSPAIAASNGRLIAIQMPAAWTAAVLTFQGSMDGITFSDIYDATGAEISVTVVAAHGVSLDVTVFAGWQFLKFRSGTGAAAVNQAADRTLTICSMQLIG
jgi:hypothetical protein